MEIAFAKELEHFQRGKYYYYNKSTNSVVPVYLELLVSLQNQPERRGMNYLMLIGEKYSARWGFSCNVSDVCSLLPMCDRCLLKLQNDG